MHVLRRLPLAPDVNGSTEDTIFRRYAGQFKSLQNLKVTPLIRVTIRVGIA